MFHKKDVLTQVWPLCLISTSHAREPCLSRITQNSVCSRFEFEYLSPVFKKMYSFSVSMVRRRISEAQRWQIIDMNTTGMSFKAIGRQMGYHYTVVSRLVRKHTQQCERLVKIRQTTGNIWSWQHWLPNRRLSTRTVRNRLKSAGLKSRIVIKRPLLADRHRRSRLAWCLTRRGWNLRTWRKIHWSDYSRFLLHVTTSGWGFGDTNIQGTPSQLSLTVEAR